MDPRFGMRYIALQTAEARLRTARHSGERPADTVPGSRDGDAPLRMFAVMYVGIALFIAAIIGLRAFVA